MRSIILYHVWRKTPQQQYELLLTTPNLDDAKQLCLDENASHVYSWSTAYCGETG